MEEGQVVAFQSWRRDEKQDRTGAACRALLLTWLTRPKSWQEESGMQPEARVEKTITKASAPHESSGGRFSFSRACQICVYAVS